MVYIILIAATATAMSAGCLAALGYAVMAKALNEFLG